MEVDEEQVHTLLTMGFGELEVRKALRRAKNDLNEAVAYLTNDHPTSTYDTLDEIDVEMKPDPQVRAMSDPVYGPSPLPNFLPSYEDVTAAEVSTFIFILGVTKNFFSVVLFQLQKVYSNTCRVTLFCDLRECIRGRMIKFPANVWVYAKPIGLYWYLVGTKLSEELNYRMSPYFLHFKH